MFWCMYFIGISWICGDLGIEGLFNLDRRTREGF